MYSNEDYLDNIFSSAYIHVRDNDNEKKASSKLLKDSIHISNRPDNIVNRIELVYGVNGVKIIVRNRNHYY